MLIEDLIKIPDASIVNYKIHKKDIFEAAEMTKTDKEYFVRYVQKIEWTCKFDENTIRIKPYQDEERVYLESEFISIGLKNEFQKYFYNTGNVHNYDARLDRIADIILRFIPYPTLLCAEFRNRVKFYVSHISESKADKEKITLDEIIETDWINTNDLDDFDLELIDKLQIDKLDKINVYTFYDDIVTAIIQYNGSKEAGKAVNLSPEEIQGIIDQIRELERKIDSLKAKMKKEVNFNKKVEYNVEIKDYKMEIELLKEKLK